MTGEKDFDATLAAEDSPAAVRGQLVAPGDLVDARYRLDRILGRGGMGEVWAAEHISLQRPVAIKLLRAAALASGQQRERFLREARVLSAIRHPHVVGVSDFGELPDGSPFIAMEFVRGRTLSEVIAQDGPLPWPRVVTLLRQIASALAETHRQGVTHRDLKPDNVLVSAQGSEHVTVIDFGIAGRVTLDPKSTKLTRTGKVFGTPGYMAPEQIRGEPADARSDIYALGCVAYELLTGACLFPGGLFERMESHLYRAPPPVPATVPTTLARLVERCLAKALDDRVATADQVLDILERCSGRAPRRTAARQHIPATPPGVSTPSARPTAPGVTLPSTTPVSAPPARVAHDERRGWIVAGISAAAGLGTLAVLYAAWTRTPEPTAVPVPASVAAPREPAAPQTPEAAPPVARAQAPAPAIATPKPPDEPPDEPPEALDEPGAPDDQPSSAAPVAPEKTRKKNRPPRKPAKTPIDVPPKRGDDGIFDVFAEPGSEASANGQ